MKKFNIISFITFFLLNSCFYLLYGQSIKFTSPGNLQNVVGIHTDKLTPVTISYNTRKDTRSARIEYVKLYTHTGEVYYDDIGNGIPAGTNEMPEKFYLPAGSKSYHWILEQYERYFLNGKYVILSSCEGHTFFNVKQTIRVKNNIDAGYVIIDNLGGAKSNSKHYRLVNKFLLIGAYEQQIINGKLYVWDILQSKWKIKKLYKPERIYNQYRTISYRVEDDANGAVFTAQLKLDDQPPAAPKNLTLTTPTDEPKLTWDANTELDLKEYKIIRKMGEGSFYHIATVDKSQTSFIDNEIVTAMPMDKWTYKVSAKDTEGKESDYSNEVSIYGLQRKKSNVEEKNIVSKMKEKEIVNYSIQNYPNPFNPTTQINYQLPKEGHVSLKVYNSLGEEVKTLVNDYKGIGSYNVEFNAVNLPSGIYYYQLQSGEFNQVKKMLLVK